MNTKVIVNPSSNPRAVSNTLKKALKLLYDDGFTLSVSYTNAGGEAFSMAREAAEAGYRAVIAVGGDGTVNEVINGIFGSEVILGLLPVGARNVLARELRIPLDVGDAARVITRKTIRKMDLGCIDGRYFSMMASCGFDAYTVHRTSMKIKKIIRQYAYILAGLKDLLGYAPSMIHVDIDNGAIRDSGTFVIISNTHYYGGSYQITPFAEIDDGFLDVCVFQGNSQLGLIHFGLNMLSRKHLAMQNVNYYRARQVVLRSEENAPVQVDGDPMGVLPAYVHIVPGALKIFCLQEG